MKRNRILWAIGVSAMLGGTTAFAVPLYDVVVAADGSGDYTSIQAALDHAPHNSTEYVVFIRDGVYQEKVEVTRPHVSLIGQSRAHTVIEAATANGMLKADGHKFGTFGSRTLSVNADGFSARSLTIKNSFDYLANAAKSNQDPSKIKSPQAVALLVADAADHAQFKDVSLVSHQDTLYLRGGHSFFDRSRIAGNVDFIFGPGTALIQDSDIVARYRADVATGKPYGYITAPATNIHTPYGLVFKHSRLIKEQGVPAKSYGLGRPWHPTTTFADGRYADPDAIGNTMYINCWMDDHIYGWDRMSGHDVNHRTVWFYPEQSRFWEYHSSGAGSAVMATRPQLSDEQASTITDQAILSGWTPDISLGESSQLEGDVLHHQMVFPATVTVKDSLGKIRTTETDLQGHYLLSVATMTPPLLLSADDHSGQSCLTTNLGRSVCVAALVVDVNNNGMTEGNINPFSDLIVSVMAHQQGLLGPQELVESSRIPALPHRLWREANQHFRDGFNPLLRQYGIDRGAVWDPVSYGEQYRSLMQTLTQQVVHNRGYDSKTGLSSGTTLTDLSFRPILSLDTNPVYYLARDQLASTQDRLVHAKTRIFIVGDSTASYYEPDVFPRTGWGQALNGLLRNHPDVLVVNAARSGRSSRDYINGRWLSSLVSLIQPGDYLFIQFGHNDEKCDRSKPGRGPVDVANLCTYPNDAKGLPQYPAGFKEMSMQYSLEQYLLFAEIHHLHPVFLTSLPRAITVKHTLGVPLDPVQHVTQQNRRHGFAFVGNYTETVKHTARMHGVPLIDVQQDIIQMVDQSSDWKRLWLAVNSDKYPYYLHRTGNLANPDATHLQLRGAQMVAKAVFNDIKHAPELHALAVQL